MVGETDAIAVGEAAAVTDGDAPGDFRAAGAASQAVHNSRVMMATDLAIRTPIDGTRQLPVILTGLPSLDAPRA